MKLFFEPLDEARIKDANKILDHYNNHVLKPGEQFNSQNPKFPYMPVDDYLDAGEELSLEHAEPIGSSADVVGWVIYDHNEFRNLKFRKTSKFMSGYSDVCIYQTDFSDIENTFMLVKPSRLSKYEKLYYCDLGNFNN